MNSPERISDQKLSTGLSGTAGEYFVAAELSRRGYIATVTVRNARGIDILVANESATRSVGIQVKTNQGSKRKWLLTRKVEADDVAGLFFVFVNLHGVRQAPSYHIVRGEVVRDRCRSTHAQWLATPGRAGRQHEDNTVRVFEDDPGEYIDRWDLLPLDP